MKDQMKDKNSAVYKAKMEDLAKDWNIILAYVYRGDKREEFVFKNTAKNIAAFISARPGVSKMIFTDIMDILIIDTIGNFIDHCQDKELLESVKQELIAIHMEGKEAAEFFCPTRDEFDDYFNGNEEDTYAE